MELLKVLALLVIRHANTYIPLTEIHSLNKGKEKNRRIWPLSYQTTS